ncbi:MAG: peptidoglycan DD-metalloendopeptidase family protein [Clostridiales bacterium]|nr:peptidoglycan DD-metalloendopeptidase family protein [Clostridiales bacterium]
MKKDGKNSDNSKIVDLLLFFFEKLYIYIYFMGRQCCRYVKRLSLKTAKKLKKPLYALKAFLRFVFMAINRYALKSFHAFVDSFRVAKQDLREAIADYKALPKKERSLKDEKVKASFGKVKTDNREVVATITNFVVPALALVILLSTIGFWNNITFALQLSYNDEVVGCVANESVLLDAQAQANDRLSLNTSSAQKDDVQAEIKTPEYNIVITKKNELLDATAMCDKLIDSSETKITNACGIYIDGEFICAVKNETDALSVFDAIKENYVTDDPTDIIDFVEKVEYVQGLYPDNESVIWDAKILAEKLNTTKTEAVYHQVTEGDSLSAIAQAYDTTSAELKTLNPSIKDDKIYIGDKLLVSHEVKFIRVKVMKTETKQVEIPYETEKTNDSSLYKGSRKVAVAGKTGLANVTELVSYVDGIRVSSEEISRVVVKEPVTEKIRVGTKSTSSYYASGEGSYTVTTTSGRFIWPAVGISQVTRGFGYHSSSYTSGYHKGIDITGGGAYGRRALAADSGTVTSAGWNGSYGYCVIVDHGGGLSTLYGHLSKISVRAGQSVSQGQTIGFVGNSGYSFGAHLHFEVRVNGTPVNPYRYLR